MALPTQQIPTIADSVRLSSPRALVLVTSEAEPSAEDAAGDWREDIELYSRVAGSISELTHLRRSLLFAELAQIAYLEPEHAEELAKEIGFDDVVYFDNDGAQAYLFESEHDRVIAFRGTEPTSWNDVKADADAVMAAAETMGRVHRGFKTEVDDLWQGHESCLEQSLRTRSQEHGLKPLWLTGHSLGGAMAVIASGRCTNAKPAGVFTFGSPRVGDREYVTNLEVDHFRWVDNNDIVTRLPPAFMGFRHFGQEHYIDSSGRLSGAFGWRRVLDRIRGFVLGLAKASVDHFSDHSIDQYVDHIHRAVAKAESRDLSEASLLALEPAT